MKGCIKCMTKDGCYCLPTDDYESTDVYIRKNVVETKKALMVTLLRQELPNGFKIPAGTDVWIPGGSSSLITGDRRYPLSNWKLNEVIKSINMRRL